MAETAREHPLPGNIDETGEWLRRGNYIADRGLATVVYLSLHMGRPLLLEGEAGVGKTEVAKVLAATLGRELIRLQCYEGLDLAAAAYEWNYPRQMLAIRLAEAKGAIGDLDETLYSREHLIERPLLAALTPREAGPPRAAAGRDRPRRRAVRSLSPRAAVGFPAEYPGARDRESRGAADCRHYLEPHAGGA